MAQTDTDTWRRMTDAPRDGSRIYVAVRASEQGAAEVDIVAWSGSDQAAEMRWLAADSSPDSPVTYSDGELAAWMPIAAHASGRPNPPGASDPGGGEVDGSSI